MIPSSSFRQAAVAFLLPLRWYGMAVIRLSRKLQIGVLVHETSRLRRKAIDQLLQPMGITGTQWWVLTTVSLRPGLSQARLADELNLGKVAIGGLIDRLMKNELIVRKTDCQDKRINRIFLSEAGSRLVRQIGQVSSGVQERALSGISPDEIDATIETLSRMMANLQSILEENGPASVTLKDPA